uniref:Uncharacterized protein n=1 Tax=Clytia hemisphaerica TaxID=252671 RepID=A0A7M5UMG5_9CNID
MSSILKRGESTTSNEKRLPKKKKKEINYVHCFGNEENEFLDALTLGTSIMELLNHLLYVRSQVPMPLVMLSQMMDRKKQTVNKNPLIATKATKKETSVHNLSLITKSIRKLFALHPVRKIALILGSTTISPKETFLIRLDSELTDICQNKHSMDRPNGSIVRRFLRGFVTNEALNDLQSIRPQSIHILFSLDDFYELDEDLGSIFIPKANYRVPSRGVIHHIDVCLNELGAEDNFLDELSLDSGHWYAANLTAKGFREN